MSDPTEPNHHAQEVFRSFGEDPSRVLIADISSAGYYTAVTDAHGKWLTYGDGNVLRDFHPWPTLGHWLAFMEAAAKDNAYRTARNQLS